MSALRRAPQLTPALMAAGIAQATKPVQAAAAAAGRPVMLQNSIACFGREAAATPAMRAIITAAPGIPAPPGVGA